MTEEDIKREMELEKRYNEVFNKEERDFPFPKEWYSIKDYKFKGDLLEKALINNTPVEDLEVFKIMHENELRRRIDKNIEQSVQDRISGKKKG